jgi:hypothetical protein
VVLQADDQVVATSPANQSRPDLAQVGLRENCGFTLPLPASLPARAKLSVRLRGGAWVFSDEPLLLTEAGRMTAQAAAPQLLSPPRARADMRLQTIEAVREQRRRLSSLSRPDARPERARREAALGVLGMVSSQGPASAPVSASRVARPAALVPA